jgi:hypothetical protein
MCDQKCECDKKLEYIFKLQCKLMDDVRREIEKLRKTIEGQKHPMAPMSEDVRRLLGKEIKQPEIPLDDII